MDKIAEYNRQLDEKVDKVLNSKIEELRNKSELGRAVRVQANTVHDLMADIRFLLGELERKDREIQKLREERDILIGGLRHYASKPCIQKEHIGKDIGYIARKYLREIGVTME